MKRFVLSILFLLSSVLLIHSQSHKAMLLDQTIHRVIDAYNKKDNGVINNLVNPDFGLYLLLKVGGKDVWYHRSQLCLEAECIQYYHLPTPYPQMLMEQQIDSGFDIQHVDTYQDSVNGIYVDEENLHVITNAVRKFNQESTSKSQIDSSVMRSIWRTENASKRIVVIQDKDFDFWGNRFIFYLSYNAKKWYLTAIDYQ